ncbi:Ppx-GppA-domain-containing protein [Viridothelium virens]|uniref:Ppx-GppA-domain-containing protein n=1 Tax=Viridothelium virens TaxID=1048519 RepID=A0A6A6H4Z6_VIRVR|nr:Ppx-GppA-domain-containing protein [Viridothelium virens]
MADTAVKDFDTKRAALVDMGSNGIRLSITDISGPFARLLPTLYTHRVPISLYAAQHPSVSTSSQNTTPDASQPIPQSTITQILTALNHFRVICEDFFVPSSSVRVLATEASRTAPNASDLVRQIQDATGWTVEVLAKEDEGRIGAWGVAWGFERVKGLVMDLGGGSTQMTWVNAKEGDVRMGEGDGRSLPYGAAALMKRLGDGEGSGEGMEKLRGEVVRACKGAFEEIGVPSEALKEAERVGGLDLYLSGGGFRGWGYVLMSEHPVQPYPIPIINGFTVPHERFRDTEKLQAAVKASQQNKMDDIFRVSERRASQVPAVAFLIQCLTEALPMKIKDVIFGQGGVREGALFENLGKETRALDPLAVAGEGRAVDWEAESDILRAAIPSSTPVPPTITLSPPHIPEIFTPELLGCIVPSKTGFADLDGTKETTASVALRLTTSGAMAKVLPLRHNQRAAIALALCARYGGPESLPPEDRRFLHRLQALAEPEISWWCNYIGAVAALISHLHPVGFKDGQKRRINLRAEWVGGKDKKNADANEGNMRWILRLRVNFENEMWREAGAKALGGLEKVGKRKNWIGGREGVGWKIKLEVG